MPNSPGAEGSGCKYGTAMPWRVAGPFCALLIMLSAAPAAADPVRMVTAGSVYQLVEDGETGFSFVGDGFRISGGEVDYFTVYCGGFCPPGGSMNLSATMRASAFPPGTATIDGHTYGDVYFSGNFQFDAGWVTIPQVQPGDPEARPTTPFRFVGTLAGYADPSRSGTPLFSTALTGRGFASIGFFNYGAASNNQIISDGFNYEFENAPVPEPGSLFLFGSGAAWLAGRWRRRTAT